MTWVVVALAAAFCVNVVLVCDYVARRRWWRLGPWTRKLYPNRAYCLSCGTASRYARLHRTRYRRVSIGGEQFMAAIEPLCERCWHDYRPDERMPFYEEAWLAELGVLRAHGLRVPPSILDEIRAAVALGQ